MLPTALADSLCYLNGRLQRLGDAQVSVLDRGFLFGDGVYDATPVYGGKLFRFDEHMARLDRSLGKLRIANPLPREQWLAHLRTLIRALIEQQGAQEQVAYVQVTRGVAPRDHAMPKDIEPTVFMMATPLKAATPEQRHHGVACTTARDFRWERGDIKSISLLGNVLARQLSADQGAVETILFRDTPVGGPWLTEASSSNVWIVKDGVVLGAPKSEHVLEGIRYELLRELCEDEGLAYHLKPISEADVRSADEVMLTSAGKEVLPVTTLDHEPVGHGALRGKPGPVYARLHEAYQRAKRTMSI